MKAEPWKKPNPKKKTHTKLTAGDKASAKASAKRAGRPYPNLVDNMHAAAAQKGKSKAGTARKTKTAASKKKSS